MEILTGSCSCDDIGLLCVYVIQISFVLLFIGVYRYERRDRKSVV